MEITTQNFEQEFDNIKQAIIDSDFIAMDTEFTGLEIGEKAEKNRHDSSNKMYKKYKYVWEKFSAIQIGLWMFTWDEESNWYLSHPYNFYVLPISQLEDENQKILYDMDTCKFHQKHHFDWELLFKYGISYKEKIREESIHEKWNKAINIGFISDKKYSKISKRSLKQARYHLKSIQDFWFNKDLKELIINEENSLVRKEVRKLVFKNLNTKGFLELTENAENRDEIKITKTSLFNTDNFCYIDSENSDEDTAPFNVSNQENYLKKRKSKDEAKKMQEEENRPKVEALFRKEYGFTRVINIITENKKPLVAHNCLYDIIYFYRQFIAPLPDTLKEFKEKWRTEFPETYDTKHIWLNRAFSSRFSTTALQTVYKTCMESPKFRGMVKIKFQEGFDRYKNETKCHEAAYDAHMTACAFANLWKSQEVQAEFVNQK